MGTETTAPAIAPDRTSVIPDTYALYVTDDQVHVWQYRVTMADRDGDWHFEETLDIEDEPRLSLEYARPVPSSGDGYWLYSRAYDCELDCD